MDRIALTTEERVRVGQLVDFVLEHMPASDPDKPLHERIKRKVVGTDIISKLLAAGFVEGKSHRGHPAMILADPAGNGTAAFTNANGLALPTDSDWALEIRTWSHPDDDAETDIQCDDTRFQAGLSAEEADEAVQVDEVIALAVARIADVEQGI